MDLTDLKDCTLTVFSKLQSSGVQTPLSKSHQGAKLTSDLVMTKASSHV